MLRGRSGRIVGFFGLTTGLLLGFFGTAAGQNLLHDGDFDSVAPFHDGDVGNWWFAYGSGGGHIQVVNDEGSTSGTQAAAFNVANNSANNDLGQDFFPSTGQTYALEFDAAIYGTPCAAVLGALPQLKLQIRAGTNTLLDALVTPPYADPTSVPFRHYRYTFVAVSAPATTLEFEDFVSAANSDIVLDSVSIKAVSPTPTPTPIPSPNPGPNIVANGNFETGPVDTNGSVTGWTVVGGKVAVEQEGSTSGNYCAAFDVAGQWPPNALIQTVKTSPGHLYFLNFDVGVFGHLSCVTQLRVQVLGNSTLLDETATPAYADTFSSPAVAFQPYQFYFVADSEKTTLRFTNMGNGQTSDLVLDSVSVAAQQGNQLTFTQWKGAHFTPAQQNDSNTSGWAADPDKDGISNGLEYFFDTDPMGGIHPWEAAAVPRTSVQTDNGSHYVTFSYRRLIGWNGNQPVVAVANNFSSWDTSGTQIEQVGSAVPVGDGITETVTVRFKTSVEQGLQRKYIRLQLAQ